jgi:hypothetical protein
MADNRRRHPRVRAQGIVAHLRGPTGRYPCSVENISVGGLFVRTDRVLDVGTQLEIDLVRPGWKRGLSFFVRVTSRIDPLAGRFAKVTPGMGVQFFGKMDEQHRERLLALLKDLGAPEPLPDDVSLESEAMELPPLELDGEMPLETETPLWQQVSMVAEANDAMPLDAESFPRPPRERALPRVPAEMPAPPPAPPRLPPTPPPSRLPLTPSPSRLQPHSAQPQSRPQLVSSPPFSPQAISSPPVSSQQAAPAAAPAGPTAEARLMLQIRGLLMELSTAQQQLSQREFEIERLKAELAAARGT